MIRDKIAKYIENKADWLVERTVEFTRTPSISCAERDIVQMLVSCLRSSGLSAFTDQVGNVVASFKQLRSDSRRYRERRKDIWTRGIYL